MAWDSGLEKESAAYAFAANDSRIIRVVAGPGTGKSFGLKRRVARLLEKGENPRKILAVTFTRTAANDLKSEIQSLGCNGAEKVVAKTLHGLCFGMLRKRRIIEKTGRNPRPILEFELAPMLYDIQSGLDTIAEKKKRLHAFEAAWARLQSETPGFPTKDEDRAFQDEIQRWLQLHRAMLFGEMIIEAFHYLRDNPMCDERQEFDHVLVDEYQDLNKAEQAVIEMLASNGNLVIIGDDDQSIYSFKHANPEGIREFPQKHEGCAAINFDHCRRCPKRVVAMASQLISHNRNRTLGELHPYDKNNEGKVEILQWKSLEKEIEGLSERIYEDISNGNVRSEEVLILVPVGKIGRRIREALVSKGINAKSYFKETAISRKESQYNYSLLTLLANPQDMVALRYLLGFGNNTYRAASYKKLLEYLDENDMSTIEILDKCISGEKTISGILSLLKQYRIIKEKLDRLLETAKRDNEEFVNMIAEDIPENTDFRRILHEAIASTECKKEEGIKDWLHEMYEHVAEAILYPDNTADRNHVRIMSLHASKGLSAKYVVIMSAIDDLIPRLDTKSDLAIQKQIEEQRRLFYVAITRCKSSNEGNPGTLIISSFVRIPGKEALAINIEANPQSVHDVSASRFIREFDGTAPVTIGPGSI